MSSRAASVWHNPKVFFRASDHDSSSASVNGSRGSAVASAEKKRPTIEGYVGQAAIPPGRWGREPSVAG